MAVVSGAVAGAAGVAATVVPGLVPRLDPAPSWGAAWSTRVVGADAVAAAAVSERLALATGLLLLVTALGLFTVVLLLVGGRERRRPGLAVRHALGAGWRRLATHLLRRDRRRLAASWGGGIVVGTGAALLLRATWPGGALPWGEPPGTVAPGVVAVAVVGVAALAAILVLALLSPLPGLDARAPALLRRGHGVTDDPRAGTVRRGAATLQVGLSFALALTGIALVRGLPGAPGLAKGGATIGAVARYAVDPAEALQPGDAGHAALLASVGAWTGVGTRDLVTVECGACVRGTFYLPVYGVDSTVHAVGPDVLQTLGSRVVEGRGLGAGDGRDTELVGVVNEAFRSHFEGGEPVGRRIRLSGSEERWVRVVGVVSDPPFRGPGAPEADDPVLWVPLAQHPATLVEGPLAAGSPADPETGPPTGLRRLTEPVPVDAMRRAAVAPVAWAGWVLLVSGAVALLLALVSSAEVARVEARGRARAAAIRLSVGASPRRPAAAILRRATKGAVLGVVIGLAVSWALEDALGAGGTVGMGLRAGLAVAVLAAAVAGALPRVIDLFRLQPARLLREE